MAALPVIVMYAFVGPRLVDIVLLVAGLAGSGLLDRIEGAVIRLQHLVKRPETSSKG